MPDIPKSLKRLVREWAGVAHERDLRTALNELRIHFDRMERGEISPFELNDLLHRYHQGKSREIWKRYHTNHREPVVAGAIANGVLRREELPRALLRHVTGWIELYESHPPTMDDCPTE
jgi:hypothetical protein